MSTQEPNRPHTAEHAARAATCACLALALASLVCPVHAPAAQERQEPTAAQPARDDVGPPPIRHISDATRRQLDEARDVKARTRLALELLEQSLARSAAHAAADRFEDATGELGVYEALVLETLSGVRSSGRVTNKQRDLYKKIELTLRSHVTRLETIRRSLPARNGVHVAATIEFIRDQRDVALNSFYDDTVIPDERPKEKSPTAHSAKGSALAPSESEKKPDQR